MLNSVEKRKVLIEVDLIALEKRLEKMGEYDLIHLIDIMLVLNEYVVEEIR